ncbi:hypothetical protein BDP27DRAFT_1408677 [Rhodocollybia butyracea]|uniref:Uncharacterized protein n=1 Tax=Rhodocollybia butyracea TaxID=206335 RepID=A0A9P5P961_9AGAR|nr:hypothetical protein BDP27DRAFT_1408677 [Rhodocollybia butyracea]
MHNGAIDDTGDFASDKDGNASVPAPQRKKAKRSTRKCIADILNMTQVTARSIAYCAVMLRFALSPVEIWGKDESFNYEGLYNTILDYFECPEPGSVGADHANDLLKWWNVQVFNTEDKFRNLKPIFNFENTINAQRAAKQASTAAAATGRSAIQPTPTAAS